MFVPVCDRPSVAKPTGAQDRAVMETKSGTIHRKMPMPARQLPITGSAHKAGIVGDADLAAALTVLDMAPTGPARGLKAHERCCAAALDGRHHLHLVAADVPALALRHAAPWSRKISATSNAGRGTAVGYDTGVGSFRLFLSFLRG